MIVLEEFFPIRGWRNLRRRAHFGPFDSPLDVFVIVAIPRKILVIWSISCWKFSLSNNIEAIVIIVLRIPIFYAG